MWSRQLYTLSTSGPQDTHLESTVIHFEHFWASGHQFGADSYTLSRQLHTVSTSGPQETNLEPTVTHFEHLWGSNLCTKRHFGTDSYTLEAPLGFRRPIWSGQLNTLSTSGPQETHLEPTVTHFEHFLGSDLGTITL